MMMKHPVYSLRGAHRSQAGFTLLEVLIALLVLSIGLLGLAALQAAGLRSSHGAYLSSQATLLAYDMADRIRAAERIDTADPGDYLYNGDMGAFGCDNLDQDVSLGGADRDNWLNSVACYLPSGTGRVEMDADDYVVTVEWTDTQLEAQGDGVDEWSYQLRVRL